MWREVWKRLNYWLTAEALRKEKAAGKNQLSESEILNESMGRGVAAGLLLCGVLIILLRAVRVVVH